jgi:hypothetical protein
MFFVLCFSLSADFASHIQWAASNLSAVCTVYRTVAPQQGGGIANYKVWEEAMSETDDGLLTAAAE